MINIGLTGNICSGYEQVAEIFKVFHAPVFDADIVLKFLLNYRQDIIRPIKIKFGSIYEKGVRNGFADPCSFYACKQS